MENIPDPWSQLVHRVQTSGVYQDCKTFVDKPLKYSKDEILAKFEGFNGDNAELERFVDDNFEKEGEELVACALAGYTDSPEFLETIKDEEYREFAKDLNSKWKELGRQIKREVEEQEDRHSLIYVKGPFTVPGGRFREYYYWDTYWAIQGMLLCGLAESVKPMIQNLRDVVERYGFIPNGGRKYYLNRSQPPMLIPMVVSYMNNSNDEPFLRDNIQMLEKEYQYWVDKHTVSVGVDGELADYFQYRVEKSTPRAESYLEDLELAMGLSEDKKEEMYADLATAAESGWDFSTRWFDTSDPDKCNTLSSIATRNVVPVDLNAFLCWNTRHLMTLYDRLGVHSKVEYYREEYNKRQDCLNKLFWDEEKGSWFDYHLKERKRDTRFFASAIVPMFTGCHGVTNEEKKDKEQKFLAYLKKAVPELESYQCGVPTSLTDSGQQWDYPNAWPPLQHMWIKALSQSSVEQARDLGHHLASKWVRANWTAWKGDHIMYEKYNAVTGAAGEGGEYVVQVGFGWSNGVILDLLSMYPNLKSAKE